jgi:hypothetical protein
MDQVTNLMIDETRAKLDKHEAVCELRYDSINARLKRIETILIASCGFIIACLFTIVAKIH